MNRIPLRAAMLRLILSLACGAVLLSSALSQPSTRPKEAQSRPAASPAPAAIDPASTLDLDTIEEAMKRQIAPLLQEVEKLSAEIKRLSDQVEALRKRQSPATTDPRSSSDGKAPSWQYWTLLLLGCGTLALLVVQLTSRGRARAEAVAARAPERATSPSPSQTRRHDPDYKTLESNFQRQSSQVAELRRELNDLKAASNRRTEQPLPQSPPPLPPREAPRPFSTELVDVLHDFNGMAADPSNSRIDAFVKRWGPKEVTMINFDQRVAESAHPPELRVADGKGGDVHFWFFGPSSSWITADGYLLPAKSLFRYQSALGQDATVNVMRTIFEIVRAESFKVDRAAQARMSGSVVTVHSPGTLSLPRLR